MLRHRQDNNRDVLARVADLLDQLRPLDLALQQQIDHHDVRSELPRRLEDLCAVAQDLEQFDLRLGAEEVSDVLTDLRNILRDQKTDRAGARHGPTISRSGGGPVPPPRYQDGSFVVGADRIEVVVARQDLHLQVR